MSSYQSLSDTDTEIESVQSVSVEWVSEFTHHHPVFERQDSGQAYRKPRIKARSGKMSSSRSSSVASVVSHHSEQSSVASHQASAAEEPTIIHAPAIHQEVVTHHRHIDHGFQHVTYTTPAPAPAYHASTRVQDEAAERPPRRTTLQAQKSLLSEYVDTKFAAFTKANDLKFENDLRRLIWSSGVSSEVFDQLVGLHKIKQERKSEILRHGPEALHALPHPDRNFQGVRRNGSAPRSASSDYSQQLRHRGRRHRTRSEKLAQHVPLGNVLFRVAPDDKHRRKITISPQVSSVYIGGPSGHVEFGFANSVPQHAEELMLDDEAHDERRKDSLPDVPTPPPETSQAMEQKAHTSRSPMAIKEDLVIELLERLVRRIDAMEMKPGFDSQVSPTEETRAAYQAAKTSANSVAYSDNEPDNESQQEGGKKPVKQIAGPPQKQNPPPWKRQQKHAAQSSIPVAV